MLEKTLIQALTPPLFFAINFTCAMCAARCGCPFGSRHLNDWTHEVSWFHITKLTSALGLGGILATALCSIAPPGCDNLRSVGEFPTFFAIAVGTITLSFIAQKEFSLLAGPSFTALGLPRHHLFIHEMQLFLLGIAFGFVSFSAAVAPLIIFVALFYLSDAVTLGLTINDQGHTQRQAVWRSLQASITIPLGMAFGIAVERCCNGESPTAAGVLEAIAFGAILFASLSNVTPHLLAVSKLSAVPTSRVSCGPYLPLPFRVACYIAMVIGVSLNLGFARQTS